MLSCYWLGRPTNLLELHLLWNSAPISIKQQRIVHSQINHNLLHAQFIRWRYGYTIIKNKKVTDSQIEWAYKVKCCLLIKLFSLLFQLTFRNYHLLFNLWFHESLPSKIRRCISPCHFARLHFCGQFCIQNTDIIKVWKYLVMQTSFVVEM